MRDHQRRRARRTMTISARCVPSTSTLIVPSGSFSSCSTLRERADRDTGRRRPARRRRGLRCATSRIRLSASIAMSSARIGFLAADEQRDDHVREHHHVAQRQHRQFERIGSAVCHGALAVLSVIGSCRARSVRNAGWTHGDDSSSEAARTLASGFTRLTRS